MKILHCFADTGVESEALSAYGEVTRVGLDPEDTPFTDHLIQADARELSLSTTFDLGLFHPPCPKWATPTHIDGDRESHDNLIPNARDLAREYCDDWIIENVPNAPLHEPVTLNGGMFGLPLHYERSFETSYHVDQPRQQKRLTEPPERLQEHHATGHFTGSKELWKSVKGYTGDYDSRSFKRSAVPRPYLNYLIRPLL